MAAPEQSERLKLVSRAGEVLVTIALVLTLIGGWIASTRPVAAIDQSKLQTYQESLQSYAAEGSLLAQQLKAQRPTAAYAEVSFKKLFQATTDLADNLKEQQPEASLSKAVKQTDDQADKLADAFAKLSQLPSGAELNSLISNVTSVRQQLEKSLESS
jgi:hypothetical protein